MTQSLSLMPNHLDLPTLRALWLQWQPISLDPACRAGIDRSAAAVAKVVAEGRVVYGINTGFGLLANTRIDRADIEDLQRRIVLSHAAGVGERMPTAVVRLMLILKITSLAQGFSGIRNEVIDALLALHNHQVYPCVPSQGSVGASGDLAPLAHLVLPLLGEGEVEIDGEVRPATEGLARAGLKPMSLAAKEGLALLNGTQASTALALAGLFAIENDYAAALVAGAMSVDAALGSRAPFDPRIHQVRGHKDQADVAGLYRHLLRESEIGHSHADCDRVQDPYSLRCQPQVMGACLRQIRDAAAILLVEANAVSDNPLVFVGDDDEADILSGGNFHAEPVALAADNLALAAAEIGALSERRIALLIDRHLSQLPAFLVENGGLNSGFMLAQVTSAALASENKSLAHPASVDSLPTSANQEDHVSMATFAARRLRSLAFNTANIIAIEWLAAAQGLDFRAPLKSSEPLQEALAMLRAQVPFYAEDRYFAPDIAAAAALIESGHLNTLLPAGQLPSL